MDPLTLLLTVLGLIIAAVGSWYTYMAYRRSQPARQGSGAIEGQAEDFTATETLFLMLLVDQFPLGLWGASLEKSADLYGHKGDPGSITISTLSSRAITAVTGSRAAEPIRRYRAYLLSRRSPRGAFGMRRAAGTVKYPEEEVLEHARHTSTGLRFFLFYDGPEHYCVVDALRYLLSTETRTASGLWVDHGERSDSRVDPITVAFVTGALEELRVAISISLPVPYVVEPDTLDAAITLGLEYVFSTPLRTDAGLWCYRYSTPEEKLRVSENLYQYSTDVLSNVARSCRRLRIHVDEANQMVDHLVRVNSRYQGLPRSPASNVPDLDASATLLTAARLLERPETLQRGLYDGIMRLTQDPAVMTASAANGWAAVLCLADLPWASELRLSTDDVDAVYGAAQRALSSVREGKDAKTVLPQLRAVRADRVEELVRRRGGVQPT